MRITKHTADQLDLRGRRIDKEEGEDGTWLLWLVAAAFLVVGPAFFVFGPGDEMRTPAILSSGIGLLVLLSAVWIQCRRESLRLRLTEREAVYGTAFWPMAEQEGLRFPLDDIRAVELRTKVESVGQGRHGSSKAFVKWKASLVLPRNKRILLDRHADEERVRTLATTVADVLGVEIRER